MAKTVKMCDMNKNIAVKVFSMLNDNTVRLITATYGSSDTIIITDVEPNKLVYPEGWYYAKGCFRNKHTCTTSLYEEVPMYKSNGTSWEYTAHYCTLD